MCVRLGQRGRLRESSPKEELSNADLCNQDLNREKEAEGEHAEGEPARALRLDAAHKTVQGLEAGLIAGVTRLREYGETGGKRQAGSL